MNRVAIVFYETYLGCAPSLINACRILDERGYRVDVYVRASADEYVATPDLGKHTRVIAVDPDRSFAGPPPSIEDCQKPPITQSPVSPSRSMSRPIVRRIIPQDWLSRLSRIRDLSRDMIATVKPQYRHQQARFLTAVRSGFDQCKAETDQEYLAIIGVDMHGLVAATEVARAKQVPVFYWSLEIMFLRDFWSPAMRRLKNAEKRCHQSAHALVIQDRERQDSLSDENKAHGCPAILVPNSPRGTMDRSVRRDRFHRQFDLESKTRVILHAGSVCEGMRSSDLAASTLNWPDHCRLIFHSHTILDLRTNYYRDLIESGRGRVDISTTPVPYDELDELMASADIGIVLYDGSLGPNFQLLAGASGKLAHYLRCGVPVISVGNPSIARVLAEHRCGIGVDRVEDVGGAIETILKDHAGYQSRATLAYQKAYEFERHFEVVIDRLARCH